MKSGRVEERIDGRGRQNCLASVLKTFNSTEEALKLEDVLISVGTTGIVYPTTSI